MPAPLAKRLALKPGACFLVMRSPEGYLDMLGDLPEGVGLSTARRGEFDCIQLFRRNAAEVQRDTPAVLNSLSAGGVLWFAYPKRSSGVETDVARDRGWDALSAAGWRPVSQISIDDTWSALRFRPAADVRSHART